MLGLKERHDAIVAELTQRYESQGYHVLREPSELIKIGEYEYRPDLMANRGTETIVVEVKVSSSLENEIRWSQVADVINARPGWRFVLVLGAKERFEELEIPSIGEINNHIIEVKKLSALSPSAALLLAWAAFEASARLALLRIGHTRERSTPGSLISAIAQHGLVSPEEESQLQRLVTRRNRIAHGEFSAHVNEDDSRALIDLTQRLLEQRAE